MHTPLFVVTKAAIYSSDSLRVLVIHMDQNGEYGLPGGHMHPGEAPDVAMARELYEECGLSDVDLAKSTFFLHENGKVVLAYTGTIDASVAIKSQQNDLEGVPTWLTKEAFMSIKTDSGYRAFVLENWHELQVQ